MTSAFDNDRDCDRCWHRRHGPGAVLRPIAQRHGNEHRFGRRRHLLLPPEQQSRVNAMAPRHRRQRRSRHLHFRHAPPLVAHAEVATPFRHRPCRWNVAQRHSTSSPVRHMASHVSKPAAPMQQPNRPDFLFDLELRPPVAEPLQRQPMQLAILSLIQSRARPLVMVKAPECLQFLVLLSADTRELQPPSMKKSVNPRSKTEPKPASVQGPDAYGHSLLAT